MRTKRFTGALAAAALAASLQPAAATAEGPVPDLPAPVPDLSAPPAVTDVSFTPGIGESGAGIDVGGGETGLQIGAGPGGLSIGVRPRGLIPAPQAPDADAGVPVRAPRDRPDRRLGIGTGATTGAGTPTSGGGGASARDAERGRRSSSAGDRKPAATDLSGLREARLAAEAAKAKRRPLPPFFELIERIPAGVKVGLVGLGLIALAVWAAWVRARRRLERNAFVDPVTGIANEPAFDRLLERELERARRYKRPLALLLLDVSEAVHGRLLQDHRLQAVTGAIRERMREGDTIARLAASRFAVISPEATASSAETLARSLESRLEEMRIHATVAAVERQPTDLSAGHLLARADTAIAAREAGRERPRGRPALRAA